MGPCDTPPLKNPGYAPERVKNDERKKKTEVAIWGFEPASQLPSAKKVRPLTTGPCDRSKNVRYPDSREGGKGTPI